MVGLYAYKDNPVPNTSAGLQEIMESKYGKYRMYVNTPVQSFDLSMAQKTSTMLQTSQQNLISSTNYRTLTSSSPTDQWYYKLLAVNSDASVTSFTLAVAV